MFIQLCKNNGTDYLRLVEGYRATDASGRSVARSRTVLNIGPLSRFNDGRPDYVKRLRESFKSGIPLIDSLLPFIEAPKPEKYTITFTSGDDSCISEPRLVSQLLLDRMFQQLGLDKICATLKHSLGLGYDLTDYLRLLIFGRILYPDSKWATFRQNSEYYTPLVNDDYPYHVYDVLDVLSACKEKFIQRMHSSLSKKVDCSTRHIYYDVTNFFFEICEPDADEEIDGCAVKGLRQKGVSKENRREPIVQMGLFLDDAGLPVTIESFPGNTLDQATLRPALKRSLNHLDIGRFILVADRGMCSYMNLCSLLDDGQGYIVSKSIRKTKAAERKWITEPEGYIQQSTSFRYKSRIISRKVKDEYGSLREIQEKVIVYWSEKFYKREYCEHKSFLEFIEKLRINPAGFRVTATQSRTLKKYFRKEFVNKDTGEIVSAKDLLGCLDEEKLEELTAYMGYYQIVSSELDMEPLEIIDSYHGLTQIEDQFREMKGTLDARPVYVSTREHIQAHLLLCMMALTILRMIQKKIAAVPGGKSGDKDRLWSYGMSGRRVQKALQRWRIEKLPGEYYRFCNTNDDDLKKLLEAFGIDITPKLYTRGELRKIKSGISL